jgi:hypothetical protein
MPLPSNDTDPDLAAALQAAREHYAPQMQQVMRDIRQLLAGRHPRQLVGRECLQHIVLRERFNEHAAAQRDFAEAYLTRHDVMEPQNAAVYG